MSPILQTLANSSAYGYRAFAAEIGGDYESIASVTVGSGGSSTITFSSIPSTYKHLQIRGIGRSDRGGQPTDQIRYRLNGDTGSNYTYHELLGNGSSASVYGQTASVGIAGIITAPTTTSGIFGIAVIDILDYADTNKYTTLRFLSGYDSNGSGQVLLGSSLWTDTSAVNSITLAAIASYVQYSSFALYGIKG
jgi:hypothetical protein